MFPVEDSATEMIANVPISGAAGFNCIYAKSDVSNIFRYSHGIKACADRLMVVFTDDTIGPKHMKPPACRREFLKRMAAALPASGVLSHFRALAAAAVKQVKITDVKVMLVRGLFDWPMVRIETDADITGIGESYWGRGVKDIMLGNLRPLLIGEDPLDVDRLYTKMVSRTGGSGSAAGTTVTAISGMEIALWDTAGKILGAPVCKLLGGQYRKVVRAYWTQHPNNMLDKSSCRDFAAMLKQHPYGFRGIKVDMFRALRIPPIPSAVGGQPRYSSQRYRIQQHSGGRW